MPKQNIVTQIPQKRVRNFSEVICGLSKKQAIEDAKLFHERRGQYEHGCPLGTDVFGFIEELSKGRIKEALDIVRQDNILPGLIGRLARDPYPQIAVHNREGQKVSVRALERFLDDHVGNKCSSVHKVSKDAGRVAVVGSGPAGLQASSTLAGLGYQVTVFESLHTLGGSLAFAYPHFRVPKSVLSNAIAYLQSQGVHFQMNQPLGSAFQLPDVFAQGFQAVFLSLGAGRAKTLDVPGEDALGVCSSDEFLMRMNLMGAYEEGYQTDLDLGQNVTIIGGGNAALDCARICIRLGRSATVVLKETEEDMNVRYFLVDHAREEGVKFEPLTRVVGVNTDELGCVQSLECRRFDYVKTEKEDEWDLEEVQGSDFQMKTDTVIVAIGHTPHHHLAKVLPELTLDDMGCIVTKDNSHATDIEGVFAGGNVTDGPGPVLGAMVSAKEAAYEIDEYLKKVNG